MMKGNPNIICLLQFLLYVILLSAGVLLVMYLLLDFAE